MTLMDWVKNNWLKIIIGIVILIIILQVTVSLKNLLDCSSPICKGISNVLGLPAKIINTVLSGCVSQSDCSQFKDSDSCGNGNGCSWSSKTTAGTCVNTTGLQTGDGGFFSPKCMLGIGLISLLALSFLAFLAKIVLRFVPPKNENVKETVEKTGKTTEEVTREVAEESRETATEAQETLTDKSPSVIELMTAKITNLTIFKKLKEAIRGTRGTPEELAKQEADATTITADTDAQLDQEAESSGASEEQINEADNAANETSAVEDTISRIQSFQSLNRVPSKNTHAFLMKHVKHHMRKGRYIPEQHLAFLKSVEPK